MPVGSGWEIPAEDTPWSQFHWFRVSPRGDLVLVVLSDEVLWYAGHFLEGRMCPCLGKECELCKQGIAGQVRYVFAAAEISSHRIGLMEVGRGVGELIRNWEPRHDGLRGMVLQFSKHSHAKQSRTEVTYVDRPQSPWYLQIAAPDVRTALRLTWKKAGFQLPAGME